MQPRPGGPDVTSPKVAAGVEKTPDAQTITSLFLPLWASWYIVVNFGSRPQGISKTTKGELFTISSVPHTEFQVNIK